MRERPRLRRRTVIRGAISVAAAFGMAALVAGMGNAGALVGPAGPIEVQVTPTSRVTDGQAVSIKAKSPTGIVIYQLRAHLCSEGRPVTNTFDFGFQGRRCANVALGHGDSEQTIEFPSGVNSAELDSFKIGAGDVRWVDELGYDQVLDCGPGHPCDLVVQAQITDSTVFFNVPLCYGPTCPASPPDPVLVAPQTTTTTTYHALPASIPPSRAVAGAGAARSGSSGSGSGGSASASTRSGRGSIAAPTTARTNARGTTSAPRGAVVHSSGGSPTAIAPGTTTPVHHGLSQGARVLLAALVGALGSAWIVSIFLRGSALLLPLFASASRRRPSFANGSREMLRPQAAPSR